MLNEKNEVIKLTESLDRGCERKHYYDLRSLHTDQPKFFVEGREIYFGLSENDRYGIYRVNIDKIDIDPVISGDFSIEEFSVRKDVIAYTKVSVTKPAEMWVKDYEKEACITRFNNHLLAKIKLSESEYFQFKQRDDSIIEGWVYKPYGFSKNKQYPAVIDVHGGPSSKFGNSLMFEHQMMCANGYGVILINIRGSDGYGQKFRDIRGEYGLWDFEDLKKGIANALKENPWIDPEKLGITGLSYGGFMTNWAITHSDLFKSAVSQNSISNWTSFYGTSDIGFVFANDHVGGNPPTNMDIFIEKSPITYAGDVDTPVLFIHSINDYRCWIDQSIQFYTILKAMGKTTRLVLFMEGSHGFRSTSRPSIRKKRIMAILDWFDTYLKK
jgi:dipeptidyl aminopeptidase/acylaminoacyl peptidase